jgi:hypothetical protein
LFALPAHTVDPAAVDTTPSAPDIGIEVLSSEEEDTTENVHSDDVLRNFPTPDRELLKARALAFTPGFALGENAALHLQRGYPSAGGNAANTDLTPMYPDRENLSNTSKPKLLEGVLGRYSTQIKDPIDGVWRDGPELDLQRDALRVDKVRMPSYDAYGWQIVWTCPKKIFGLPMHAYRN